MGDYLVDSGNARRRWRLARLTASHVDLGTLHLYISISATPPCKIQLRIETHVKLRAIHRSRSVQGYHLGAEQVLAVLDTLGYLDLLVAAVVDHGVRAPFPVAVAFFLDLEPPVPDAAVFRRVGDFLEIRHYRTFVPRVHYIVGAGCFNGELGLVRLSTYL